MTVEQILKKKYPADLVDALLQAYKEIEENYSLERWKASEVDAGQFVEGTRRIVEFELQGGSYTPIGQQLERFHDGVLKKYEQATGDESFRILIPRILRGIYDVRSKRGGGHLAGVSPNNMDATLVLANVKWVLAEVVRIASGLPPDQTQRLVDGIVERKLDMLWKQGDITRVLDTSLTANEQVLILLYDRSPQKGDELRQAIEYKNSSRFDQLLARLHSQRFIEAMADGTCLITRKGIIQAEAILKGANARKAQKKSS
jgi:hypothetical protein